MFLAQSHNDIFLTGFDLTPARYPSTMSQTH